MKVLIKNGNLILDRQKSKMGYVAFALGIYFFSMPFEAFPLGELGSLLRMIALIPGVLALLNLQSCRLRLDRPTVSLILLLLLYMVSLLYTVSVSITRIQILRQLMNIGLVVLLGNCYCYNEDEVRYLRKMLVAGSLLTGILMILSADFSADGRLSIQLAGHAEDPNYINGYLFFAMALCLDQLVRKRKLLLFVPVAVILLFSLMTGSRGALLALLCVMGITILYALRGKSRNHSRVVLVVLVLLAAAILFYQDLLALLPPYISERFNLDYIREHGFTGRQNIWAALLRLYRESPVSRQLFGYGLGTTPLVNSIRNTVAHNLWLEQLIATGAVGVILLLCVQYAFWKEAWKQKDIVLIASYLGFIVMAFSLSLTSYQPMWNCMMLILIEHDHRIGQQCPPEPRAPAVLAKQMGRLS